MNLGHTPVRLVPADASVRAAEMLASASIGSRGMPISWEDHSMERFIADLVKDFESGKVDRREFCQTVALAAAVYGMGEAAHAQANRGFKMIGINHISYSC